MITTEGSLLIRCLIYQIPYVAAMFRFSHRTSGAFINFQGNIVMMFSYVWFHAKRFSDHVTKI
jgi:hypothetical protein